MLTYVSCLQQVTPFERNSGANLCQQGSIQFKVKWEGYEKKSDQTWEPESNLEYVLPNMRSYPWHFR